MELPVLHEAAQHVLATAARRRLDDVPHARPRRRGARAEKGGDRPPARGELWHHVEEEQHDTSGEQAGERRAGVGD